MPIASPVGTTNNIAAFAVGQQSDGKVVLAGDSRVDNSTNAFGVIRLLDNGDSDTNFADNGVLESSFESTLRAMVVLPDDRIVLGGSIGTNLYFIRLNPDGSIDFTFGTGGAVAFNFGGTDLCEAMVLQSDGKIVFVGSSERFGVNQMIAGRLNVDGSIDGTFGNGGGVFFQNNGDDTLGQAITLAPDGGIIVAGATGPGQAKDFLVLRLQNDTPPPLSLSEWREQNFESLANSGDGEDPDFDGLENLVEFAFGLDPNLFDGAELPRAVLVDGVLGVSFAEPVENDVGEITYGAEWSSDLNDGSWNAIDDFGSGSVHTFAIPIDGRPRIFFRLTVGR